MRIFACLTAAALLGACANLEQGWRETFGPVGGASAAAPADTAGTSAASASTVTTTSAHGPEQSLLEAERALAAASQSGGLSGALAGAIDPADGFIVRPGGIYESADDIARALASQEPVFWQPDRAFVSSGGDMGVTSGRYVQVVTGAEAVQGRYLIVWRKDAGGVWRVLSETRTPDPAVRRR